MAEIIAKLIVFITSLVIARILSPEAFGVIATVTMIISFADMFSDSGFQKYIIQYEFASEKKLLQSVVVAFWTNLGISFLMWMLIGVFSQRIAEWVGNPGLGIVIVVAGISLPLTSFSSIQIAVYRRYLDFKTLFYVRIFGVCVPLIITIPLALLGFSYWSLIIGTISGNLVNALILTVKSTWKPTFYYDFKVLKEMLSFSIGSLIEAMLGWLTSYIGTFIVGSTLSIYYLGLYKTTMVTVNGVLAIVTIATTSVLFSSLSRLQNDDIEFKRFYLNFIKGVSFLILPMGAGIFLYKELVTSILLGNQWIEAVPFVGIYGLMSGVTLVFAQFGSEFYRAKGRPMISIWAQLMYLLFLVPTLIISSKAGFLALAYATSFIKILQILVHLCIMNFVFRIHPLTFLKNAKNSILGVTCMVGLALLLKVVNSGLTWSIFSIILSLTFYLVVIYLIPSARKEFSSIINYIKFPGKAKIMVILNK
ncbi:lipopolysaccharide biosynthesis protein [Paenibacillus sp. GCM10012306]